MKYCNNCYKEFDDSVNFCPSCGSSLTVKEEQLNTCPNCGKELDENMTFCPNCGKQIRLTNFVTSNPLKALPVGAYRVILAFMVIGCIFSFGMFCSYSVNTSTLVGVFIGLVPLSWKIPMTIHFYSSVKKGALLSTGFKVCTLLFASLIAGIILLCNDNI